MEADIFILAAGFGLLYVGGEAVVSGAAAIGMRLGIAPVDVSACTMPTIFGSFSLTAVSISAGLTLDRWTSPGGRCADSSTSITAACAPAPRLPTG